MPTAIIGIGLPGSGKTTTLKKLAADRGACYVCPDDIRERLSGNAMDHSRNAEAWRRAYELIQRALLGGLDVVVDATNAKAKDRKQMVQFCRTLNALTIGYWFRTPLAICMERNQARTRVVPDHAMERMAGWLRNTPPDLTEGFDRIVKLIPGQGS